MKWIEVWKSDGISCYEPSSYCVLQIRADAREATLYRRKSLLNGGYIWFMEPQTTGTLDECKKIAEELIASGELELDALDGMGK